MWLRHHFDLFWLRVNDIIPETSDGTTPHETIFAISSGDIELNEEISEGKENVNNANGTKEEIYENNRPVTNRDLKLRMEEMQQMMHRDLQHEMQQMGTSLRDTFESAIKKTNEELQTVMQFYAKHGNIDKS